MTSADELLSDSGNRLRFRSDSGAASWKATLTSSGAMTGDSGVLLFTAISKRCDSRMLSGAGVAVSAGPEQGESCGVYAAAVEIGLLGVLVVSHFELGSGLGTQLTYLHQHR